MIIRKSDLDKGLEVDCKYDFKKNIRYSIRKVGDEYQVYAHNFSTKKETILFSSKNLVKVVAFSNANFGLKDKVAE